MISSGLLLLGLTTFAGWEPARPKIPTLADRLQLVKEQSWSEMTCTAKEISDMQINQIRNAGISESAHGIGNWLPKFELTDQDGETINSDELLATGPMVLTYFRGGWCGFCKETLKALNETMPYITEAGARLVAVSAIAPEKSAEIREELTLSYDLLSDEGLNLARKLGIVYELMPAMDSLINEYGLDIRELHQSDQAELPIPATYVIDRQGRIVYSFVEVDYSRRAEPAEIVAALKAM